MMTDPYWNRAFEQRICKDADQTELSALIRGSTVVDAGIRDDKIADALDDFHLENNPLATYWAEDDLSLDTAVGEVHDELIRRKELLGNAYPFSVDGGQVIYKESRSYIYEFCLAITVSNITRGDNVNFPRLFERICANIFELYLGNNSGSLHTGTPRDELVGTAFCEAMKTLSEKTGEWFWSPQVPFPCDPRTTGDEGLDFVAWKEAPDRREGKLFIIGQCACGNDWSQKLYDLTLEKIGKWFNPISRVTPVRAFATPFHLSDFNLINTQTDAGLVFDRARLAAVAEASSSEAMLLRYREVIKNLAATAFAVP